MHRHKRVPLFESSLVLLKYNYVYMFLSLLLRYFLNFTPDSTQNNNAHERCSRRHVGPVWTSPAFKLSSTDELPANKGMNEGKQSAWSWPPEERWHSAVRKKWGKLYRPREGKMEKERKGQSRTRIRMRKRSRQRDSYFIGLQARRFGTTERQPLNRVGT